MNERESPIDPWKIWGREFRVPAIVGLGSRSGYNFSGLHLPVGWEKAILSLREIDRANFKKFFDWDCTESGLKPGQIKFDAGTGVLEEIDIQTEPVSRLYLETRFPCNEDGLYSAEDINNLKAAIVLQRTAIRFLNCVNPDVSYPYIDGGKQGYGSVNLAIPKEFLKQEDPVTGDYYQRRFEIEASNITGRFGMTLKRLVFDNKGILKSFELDEGNACYYHIDDRGQYFGHNVDSAWQAASLHGIGASFINGLLKRIDNKWY